MFNPPIRRVLAMGGLAVPLKVIPQGRWHAALHGYPIRAVHQAIALVSAINYLGRDDRPGTIAETTAWRIDRQPGAADVVNLQVQANIQSTGPTTVALALVPTRYHYHLGGADRPGFHARQTELTGAIQEALNRSMRSMRIGNPVDPQRRHGSYVQGFEVIGDFSAAPN
jgi:hypothetical protein